MEMGCPNSKPTGHQQWGDARPRHNPPRTLYYESQPSMAHFQQPDHSAAREYSHHAKTWPATAPRNPQRVHRPEETRFPVAVPTQADSSQEGHSRQKLAEEARQETADHLNQVAEGRDRFEAQKRQERQQMHEAPSAVPRAEPIPRRPVPAPDRRAPGPRAPDPKAPEPKQSGATENRKNQRQKLTPIDIGTARLGRDYSQITSPVSPLTHNCGCKDGGIIVQ
ncbi:hypothetical protein O1611_g2512 [Lasiodiplodia mahajangana]|uniref:Uncharacterized protein n=1 Tax=Lasiodiplodia mahajangana TaxID=1108764 RepID=A0ACC2JUP0_9PEZI|nr:hypothetical protein O1611_g2512 [Lasiodiplodia mahajangana]